MTRLNKESGITLIALIITIIILVILAAVSIRAVTNMKIIDYAVNGSENYVKAGKTENKTLDDTVSLIDEAVQKIDEIENPKPPLAGFQTTETMPYLPGDDFTPVEGTNLTNGLVIEDKSAAGIGNQYVWIEVPKTDGNTGIYKTAGLSITNFSDTELAKIKADLIAYATDYRQNNYADEYYDGCGIVAKNGKTAEQSYYDLYNKMLKSVYQNGGFWIGRYETGYAYDDSEGIRFYTGSDAVTVEHPINHKAVVKANAYPYNWVRTSQAQALASGIHSGECESSLLFGIQWDLVLKYLETKGITQAELKTGSGTWGNYKNIGFDVKNANAKYSIDNGENWTVATTYVKPKYGVLLTTGANQTRNIKQNICDLAGNVYEYTLEKDISGGSYFCIFRGGHIYNSGSESPAVERAGWQTTSSNYSNGFRVTLFK